MPTDPHGRPKQFFLQLCGLDIFVKQESHFKLLQYVGNYVNRVQFCVFQVLYNIPCRGLEPNLGTKTVLCHYFEDSFIWRNYMGSDLKCVL